MKAIKIQFLTWDLTLHCFVLMFTPSPLQNEEKYHSFAHFSDYNMLIKLYQRLTLEKNNEIYYVMLFIFYQQIKGGKKISADIEKDLLKFNTLS